MHTTKIRVHKRQATFHWVEGASPGCIVYDKKHGTVE